MARRLPSPGVFLSEEFTNILQNNGKIVIMGCVLCWGFDVRLGSSLMWGRRFDSVHFQHVIPKPSSDVGTNDGMEWGPREAEKEKKRGGGRKKRKKKADLQKSLPGDPHNFELHGHIEWKVFDLEKKKTIFEGIVALHANCYFLLIHYCEKKHAGQEIHDWIYSA